MALWNLTFFMGIYLFMLKNVFVRYEKLNNIMRWDRKNRIRASQTKNSLPLNIGWDLFFLSSSCIEDESPLTIYVNWTKTVTALAKQYSRLYDVVGYINRSYSVQVTKDKRLIFSMRFLKDFCTNSLSNAHAADERNRRSIRLQHTGILLSLSSHQDVPRPKHRSIQFLLCSIRNLLALSSAADFYFRRRHTCVPRGAQSKYCTRLWGKALCVWWNLKRPFSRPLSGKTNVDHHQQNQDVRRKREGRSGGNVSQRDGARAAHMRAFYISHTLYIFPFRWCDFCSK